MEYDRLRREQGKGHNLQHQPGDDDLPPRLYLVILIAIRRDSPSDLRTEVNHVDEDEYLSKQVRAALLRKIQLTTNCLICWSSGSESFRETRIGTQQKENSVLTG